MHATDQRYVQAAARGRHTLTTTAQITQHTEHVQTQDAARNRTF